MAESLSIDTEYDFLDDYLNDIDPDGQNKILCHWHKILWEKELPYNKGFFL